jgi:hypothetical protein
VILHGVLQFTDGLTRPALPKRPNAARIVGWSF